MICGLGWVYYGLWKKLYKKYITFFFFFLLFWYPWSRSCNFLFGNSKFVIVWVFYYIQYTLLCFPFQKPLIMKGFLFCVLCIVLWKTGVWFFFPFIESTSCRNDLQVIYVNDLFITTLIMTLFLPLQFHALYTSWLHSLQFQQCRICWWFLK